MVRIEAMSNMHRGKKRVLGERGRVWEFFAMNDRDELCSCSKERNWWECLLFSKLIYCFYIGSKSALVSDQWEAGCERILL